MKRVLRQNFCKLFAFSALLTFTLIPLRADTVTFDLLPPPGNAIQSGTVATQGFNFTSDSFHIIDQPALCAGGCVDDGSQYLAVAGPSLDSPVVVTTAGGQLFSVFGFDAAKLFLTQGGLDGNPNADSLVLLGTLSGGATVTTSFVLPVEGSFSTFSLSGFTNLTSLTIAGTGGGSTDASWGVDNLAVSAVPEPSTFVLVGCVFWGALARRRLLDRR